jgi:hypothetical protein
MAITIAPVIGIDLNNIVTAGSIGVLGSGVIKPPHKPGHEQFGDDGKLYVFAQASGAIPGATAVCGINTSTFAASATGGAYTSPAAAMATGDYGWFGKQSV